MDKRDRALLEDMISFICLNRVTTAFTLLQGGSSPQLIADMVLKNLRHDLPEELLQEYSRDSAGRIQVIQTAKIFAELIAAYEDLGAFGWAIQRRSDKGIFKNYLDTLTRQVGQFFKELKTTMEQQPHATLDALLHLPSLEELQGHIPEDTFKNLGQYYQNVPAYLYHVATLYSKQRDEVERISPEVSFSEQKNTISIITNLLLPGKIPKGGVHTDAFNKIKHQFLVTLDLSAYDNGDGQTLEFSSLSRDLQSTEGYIRGIISAARVMSDLAGVLLLLDAAGIEI